VSRIFPSFRGTGARRADDRIAELTADYEKQLTGLREENVLLHEQRGRADDYFMLLDQQRKELEAEVEQLASERDEERSARIAVGKDRDALERYVLDLERELADARERLQVRSWAEAVVTETQPIPVITRVVPLHEAPFATTNPGRVRPSWAKDDPAA
jgi:hypothetical protein